MENKLLVKLFIGSEAIFFLCLILAFVYFNYTKNYDHVSQAKLDIKTTGVYTIFLILSSVTYWFTEYSHKKGCTRMVNAFLLLTILLGSVFLYGQGSEYLQLFKSQLTLSTNTFGTSFFTLTGFHGLHVFTGIIVLSIILLLTLLGDLKNGNSQIYSAVGLYWHFVDAVWLVVFSVVYVLPLFIQK